MDQQCSKNKSFQTFSLYLDILLSFQYKAVTWQHLMWWWFEEDNPQGIEGVNRGCSGRDVAQSIETIKKLHTKGQRNKDALIISYYFLRLHMVLFVDRCFTICSEE